MEFVANLMSVDVDPVAWARDREAEGWQVLGCADHFFTDTRAYPHLWVTLTAMATATTTARLTSCFANNLLRSPVELAQAALQLQRVSDGRFELGVGAGWSRDEIVGAGLHYPEPSERAGRYAESMAAVRALLHEGRYVHEGRWYRFAVTATGPRVPEPPPLVASVGGPRTIREVSPLADRVELKAISAATRNGALDIAGLAAIDRDHVARLADAVRAVRPDVPLSLFVLCSAGTDARTAAISRALSGSFIGGFFGEPAQVAEHVRSLAELGLDRVQLSPFSDDAWPLLAPLLTGNG